MTRRATDGVDPTGSDPVSRSTAVRPPSRRRDLLVRLGCETTPVRLPNARSISPLPWEKVGAAATREACRNSRCPAARGRRPEPESSSHYDRRSYTTTKDALFTPPNKKGRSSGSSGPSLTHVGAARRRLLRPTGAARMITRMRALAASRCETRELAHPYLLDDRPPDRHGARRRRTRHALPARSAVLRRLASLAGRSGLGPSSPFRGPEVSRRAGSSGLASAGITQHILHS